MTLNIKIHIFLVLSTHNGICSSLPTQATAWQRHLPYHCWPGCLVVVAAPWSSQQSHGRTAKKPGPASWTQLEWTHTRRNTHISCKQQVIKECVKAGSQVLTLQYCQHCALTAPALYIKANIYIGKCQSLIHILTTHNDDWQMNPLEHHRVIICTITNSSFVKTRKSSPRAPLRQAAHLATYRVHPNVWFQLEDQGTWRETWVIFKSCH